MEAQHAFLCKSLIVLKNVSDRKTFSPAEISYESEGHPLTK